MAGYKLTKQKAVEEHRKMWNWIADELMKGKYTVVMLKEKYCDMREVDPLNTCFCCAYAEQIDKEERCKYCPIEWDSSYSSYMCENKEIDEDIDMGLWIYANRLSNQGKYLEAAIVARQIANLPERMEKLGDIK